jgi:RNA polymerase sigma factor (sigma-70 family)
LPFIVAATQIGLQLGAVSRASAAAVVAAGLLSVVISPALGLVLLRRQQPEAARRRELPSPERRLSSLEARDHLKAALAQLPDRQRLIVALRDIEGHSAEEVCDFLGLSQENQRVLLHRGRSRLRAVLDEYLDAADV